MQYAANDSILLMKCISGFIMFHSQFCVVQVHVAVDQDVQENDSLITLKPWEAVAAPQIITAPAAGRVSEVSVAAGRRVAANAWLASISNI